VDTVRYDITLHFVQPPKTFLDVLPDIIRAVFNIIPH